VASPENELYPNAPLREAVFEVRFPGRLRVESHRHELQEALQDEFPNLKVPVGEPEKPPLFKWYQLETEDGIEIVKTGINFISYISKRYEGYAAFKKRALAIIQPALGLFAVQKISRTGLRYINHIQMAREGDVIPIRRFINIEIGLPETIPPLSEQFLLAFAVRKNPGVLRVHVEYIPAAGGTQELLLLDFDYFMQEALQVQRVGDYLEESHSHTKTVFESFVTEDYRRFMRGEVK
jgi:uncharacterized protein (TIGR04255 family)